MTNSKRYYALRLFINAISILGAWWLTYLIRFKIMLGSDSSQYYNFLIFSPVVLVIFIFFIDSHKLLERDLIEDWAREFNAIVKVCSKSFFSLIVFFYFIDYSIFSRLSLFIFYILSLFFLTFERIIIDDLIIRRRKKGKGIKRLLLIGDVPAMFEYANFLAQTPQKGLNPAYWLDHSEGNIQGVEKVEGEIQSITRDNDIDMILVGYSMDKSNKLKNVLFQCHDLLIPVVVYADLPNSYLHNQLERDMNFNFFYYNTFSMTFTDRFFKRLIDISISLMTLILGSPLYFLLSILVKLSSKGPIFYGQKRMTRDGKNFKMWKFRSMKVDAEDGTGAVWATKNDDRTTKIGKFLRSTSLDEIPQFWNVLIGEMSLVGPRPERPELIEKFKTEIPGYMLRHKMKSGITGWAQVNGFRGNTSLKGRIEYDLYYINNWSHIFDLKILFLTLIKGFVNENAY